MESKKDETNQKADNWAEMSDGDQEEEVEQDQQKEAKPKKKVPPAQKGVKNSQGDYVVTSIDIPDMRTGVKKDGEGKDVAESESDSDTEYDEEDDQNETNQVEEVEKSKCCLFAYLTMMFFKYRGTTC